MNFPADHIERIKAFGYTESEARFLYILAVHSSRSSFVHETENRKLSFRNS